MSVPESKAHELYRLPGPRFTESVAPNAVCGIEVRCEDATYAPKFRRFVKSLSFPFGSVDLACLSSFLMPSYFQDSRTNCLNGLLFILSKAWLILSKTSCFPLHPSGRVEGFQ